MSLLIIGLIGWLAIVVLVLALLRASALREQATQRDAHGLGDRLGAAGADDAAVRASPDRTPRRLLIEPTAVLPWLAAAATVTAAAITAERVGAPPLAVLAIPGGVCAGVIGALIERARQRRLIERQAHELGLQRAEMIGLTLRLLALRDPAAARHAAAVAHHARVLARAAGLSEREQQIAHLAGLLHDLGRQRFPTGLLTGYRPLAEDDRRAIRTHPLTGAALLRTVEGFDEVAAAVEAHHERMDGSGYPHGLHGDAIPQAARIVAIAEVYDVLTAPDSYRSGADHDQAARELRRVANTQLDATLIERFLTVISPHEPRPTLDDELATAARSPDRLHALAAPTG